MAVILFCIAACQIFAAPRKYAFIPFLVLICFVSPAQRIIIGGLDFSIVRLLGIAGLLRVLLKSEARFVHFNSIDWVVAAHLFFGSVIYTLQMGTASALTYKLGISFEFAACYFFARCVFDSKESLIALIKCMAIVGVFVSLTMLFEKLTARNLFAAFGGVPEVTKFRQGKLRAQGAYPHPIIAGVFWATLVPLFVLLWRLKKSKLLSAIGVVSCLLIVLATASSTPLGTFVVGIGSCIFWKVRKQFRNVRLLAGLSLVLLHFAMDGPVWHLVARIDLVGGSTGYHRFLLIDNAIRRMAEWALVGIPSTNHWGHSQQDIANQYVLEGVRGGLVTLSLFVLMIALAFRAVGAALKQARHVNDRSMEMVVFALGTVLFTSCVAFIGVSYFGQANMLWMTLIALIASVSKWPMTSGGPTSNELYSETGASQAPIDPLYADY